MLYYFYYCNKTLRPKVTWGIKNLFQVIDFSPSSEEVSKGTQGKNLDSETDIKAVEGCCFLAGCP